MPAAIAVMAMFEETIALIMSSSVRQPIEILPARLFELFDRLADPQSAGDFYAIEDEIWDIWTSYPDPAMNVRMNEAIALMALKRYDEAQAALDDIVGHVPLWPEAWNKRATLKFLSGRDVESVRDINRTLELEPRHFGAMSGFAQICLRNGEPEKALIAYEAALAIHPHLVAQRIAVDALRRRCPPTVH
jgi:tetratricopeptide (TPR) repeat protein